MRASTLVLLNTVSFVPESKWALPSPVPPSPTALPLLIIAKWLECGCWGQVPGLDSRLCPSLAV